MFDRRAQKADDLHMKNRKHRVKKILVWAVATAFLALSVWPWQANAASAVKPIAAPSKKIQAQDFDPKPGDFKAAVVMDYKTKKILYAYNSEVSRSAASLTKLTGALVFLDTKPSWNKVVSIQKKDEVGGGRLRVASGATLTVRDTVYSSIVGSANNAATALARISGLGLTKFVRQMNAKAKALGCTNTKFKDPSGMDPENVTTAADMAKIAAAAFSRAEIRSPATTAKYTFRILNTGEVKTIRNTNQLLLDENNGLYVMGGKTGYLDEAKNNLVLRVRPDRQNAKQELIIVVLGAETKAQLFEATQRLAQWTWSAYDWRTPALAANYGSSAP